MTKLQLPNVTCMCIDGVNARRAVNVLEHCKKLCDFGAVKLLTHHNIDYPHKVEIVPLNTLIAYSIFCLTEMHKHVDTSHVLIVQRDGWILNTQTWNNDWLNYDYIAPLFVQHDDVGSGGFSMRSKKMMEAASIWTAKKSGRVWDGTDADAHKIQDRVGSYEDGVLSLSMKYLNFNIAPMEEAAKFGQGGNRNPQYYYSHPFGYHGVRQEINFETGFVHPVCVHQGEDCGCRPEIVNALMEMEK